MTFVSQKTLYVACGIFAVWSIVLTVGILFVSTRMYAVEDVVGITGVLGGLGGQRIQTTVLETGNQKAVSPIQNNTFDLGSPTSSWKSLYVSSTIHTPITGATTTPIRFGKACIPILNSAGTQVYITVEGTAVTASTVNCQ